MLCLCVPIHSNTTLTDPWLVLNLSLENIFKNIFKIFEDSVILQSVFTSAKQMLQKSGQLPNATTIKS